MSKNLAAEQVRLITGQVLQQVGDPAAIAGIALVYGKAVAGSTELFMRGGGGTISQVAGLAAPLTAGSMPFANALGQLAQDNAVVFYDSVNKAVGLGTNTPPARRLTVVATADGHNAILVRPFSATGFAGIGFQDGGGTSRFAVGYTDISDNCYLDMLGTTKGIILTSNDVGTDIFQFFPTGALSFFPSVAPAVSVAGHVDLAVVGGVLCASTSGAAYSALTTGGGTGMVIGNTITSATSGSVLVAGAAGILSQDNAAFFWDASPKRLKITQTAADPADGSGAITLKNTNAAGNASVYFHDAAGAFVATFGYDNATAAFRTFTKAGQAVSIITNNGANTWTFGSGGALRLPGGSGAGLSAAGTANFRYNEATDKLQVSKNGAAYVDII